MENNKNQQKLLDEFSAPDFDKWLALVDSQLKGVPFEKKLVTKTLEGISIQPIYLKKDAKDISGPGQFPYTRGTKASGAVVTNWEVSQRVNYASPKQFNEAITSDINNGITSVNLALDRAGRSGFDPAENAKDKIGKGGLSISLQKDIGEALNNLDFTHLTFQIDAGIAALPFTSLMLAYFNKQGDAIENISGNVLFDPLSILAVEGELGFPLEKIYDQMAGLTKWASENTPKLKTIGIDARPYLEGGGSAVQELAFALATAVEYLKEVQNRGLSINEVAANISFALATGSDFFMEIAKLRALRSLWANIVEAFGGKSSSQKATIYSCSAKYNKTIHDPYVNMLRNTTEAFSSILGGCDILSVEPFDDIQGQPDTFSRRIARNTQLVLKEECSGDSVIDPVGGSWYVEELTESLADKAWKLFQDIEEMGGMSAALKTGFPQKSIAEVHQKRAQKVAQLRNVAVGTNKYANLDESLVEPKLPDYEQLANSRMEQLKKIRDSRSEIIEMSELKNTEKAVFEDTSTILNKTIQAASKGASLGELFGVLGRDNGEITSVTPIKFQRSMEEYEALRENANRYKTKNGEFPKVFLANMGPLRQHKARADFSTGFLQPGGFQVVNSNGFDDVASAVKATIDSGANIVVLCSTDDTYPKLVPEFTKSLKAQKPEITISIAGYPKDSIESFKDLGVNEFIHLKANNLELLKTFHQKAGV
jgi:methylmalonyl-CoA mutase